MNSTPQWQKSLKTSVSRTAEAPEQLLGVCPQPPEPAGRRSAWGEEPAGQAGPGSSLAAASLAADVVVVGAVLVDDTAACLVQVLVGVVLLQHNTAAVAVGTPAAVAADMVVVAVAVVKVAAVLAGEVFRV